jgi:hypothetical protein
MPTAERRKPAVGEFAGKIDELVGRSHGRTRAASRTTSWSHSAIRAPSGRRVGGSLSRSVGGSRPGSTS